jgi:hypothetical protein
MLLKTSTAAKPTQFAAVRHLSGSAVFPSFQKLISLRRTTIELMAELIRYLKAASLSPLPLEGEALPLMIPLIGPTKNPWHVAQSTRS